MNILSEEHRDILHDFGTDTLNKAVNALGDMLKIRLSCSYFYLGVGPLKPMLEWDELGEFTVHVAKYGFLGDIDGAFYFIARHPDIEMLRDAAMSSHKDWDEKSLRKAIRLGVVSEIENLVASISITEIASFLGVDITGRVPKIITLKSYEVNDYLQSENLRIPTAFHLRAVISGVVVPIAPHFVWMMDRSFNDILMKNVVVSQT
jgi:chemotaxis protein CheY-P-specific phosphatase CheC